MIKGFCVTTEISKSYSKTNSNVIVYYWHLEYKQNIWLLLLLFYIEIVKFIIAETGIEVSRLFGSQFKKIKVLYSCTSMKQITFKFMFRTKMEELT